MTTWTGTVPTIAPGATTTVDEDLATYRDALKALSEPWTAYTPTWTGQSGNPSLGNGSFSGSAYCQINKLVHFRIVLTMGSTTTYGSGLWRMTLPVTAASTAKQSFVAMYTDTGTADYTGAARWFSGGPYLELVCPGTTAGGADRATQSNQPFTWASGDSLCIVGTYEGA